MKQKKNIFLISNYMKIIQLIKILASYKENRGPNLFNLYSPDNSWEYITNNKNLSDATKKQRLKQFINILRKATSDAPLIYKGNLPKNTKSKIKHYITNDELINYTNYLKSKGLFKTLLIVKLLFKFGLRIGALAKVKVKNLSKDINLILIEKNSQIIKKNLLEEAANKLRQLIKAKKH